MGKVFPGSCHPVLSEFSKQAIDAAAPSAFWSAQQSMLRFVSDTEAAVGCHIAVLVKILHGIAASDIIVKEAGGLFVKPDGTPILYNRDDVYNREGFIVMNKLHEKLLVK